MLRLKEINYFVSVLQNTKPYLNNKGSQQMERLYNDALIGLNDLGIPQDDESYVIDDEIYPITTFAAKVISKRYTNNNPIRSNDSDTIEIVENKLADKQEPILPSQTEKSINVTETKSFPTPVPSVPQNVSGNGVHKSQLIIFKNKAKVINKKNPSDIKEFNFVIHPISIEDKCSVTDIAIEVEHDGKIVHYVSEKNQKSLSINIDNISMTIRGFWENRKFNVQFYLTGSELNNNYRLDNSVTITSPDEVIKEDYKNEFTETVGNSIIYILPQNNFNEPSSALSRCTIVQETSDSRQIFCAEKDVLMALLDGIQYRIYGKWDVNKNFIKTIEQANA